MNILFAQADFGGCGFYRILQPAAYLQFVLHHNTKVIFRYKSENLLNYDLIVLQRQNHNGIVEAIKFLQSYNKKVIYELDDDLWNVDDCNISKPYWTREKVTNAEAIMRACDAITTSTEPLAKILRQFNDKVYVIPNYIPEVTPIEKFSNPIRIGWSGSISHKVDFTDEIITALKDIKKKYRERVELVFCGWIPDKLVGYVTFFEPVPPMQYLYFLNELRLHIGIMPCVDIKFNESKSNLKFLEYGITKTASVASPIYPYKNTITENTGILLKDNSYEEWFNAIDRLVQDESYRQFLADNAYNFVRENFLIINNVVQFEKVYQEILNI